MASLRHVLQLVIVVVACCCRCNAAHVDAQVDAQVEPSGKVNNLDDWMKAYQKARLLVGPDNADLAEHFGRKVGETNDYGNQLRVLAQADLQYQRIEPARVRQYLNEFSKLDQEGHVDAIIDTLKLKDWSLTDKKLTDIPTVFFHIKSSIETPCRDYVAQLGPAVYDNDQFKEFESRGSLAQDIDAFETSNFQRGGIRDFIQAWVHFQACKLLINSDLNVLARRTARRVLDREKARTQSGAKQAKDENKTEERTQA